MPAQRFRYYRFRKHSSWKNVEPVNGAKELFLPETRLGRIEDQGAVLSHQKILRMTQLGVSRALPCGIFAGSTNG
jgi:hypothetical protein